jgi:hypothetical protein
MALPQITTLIPFSGSYIDTTAIDGWRQGVELTLWKHFDAGTVKIRSGEPGHRNVVLNYGKDNVDEFRNINSYYTDTNNNNVALSIIGNVSVHSHPVMVRETGDGTTNQTAGILEPLNKRRKLFTPVDGDGLPLVDLHDIRSDVVIITSVFEVSEKHRLAYIDNANPAVALESLENAHPSFSKDFERLTSPNFTVEMSGTLDKMKPERWSYLAPNERTGNCGGLEDYYNSTNSISFSGRTY